MRREKEVTAMGICFAAGVGTGILPGSEVAAVLSQVLPAVILPPLFVLLARRDSRLPFLPLWFLLGLFCASAHSLFPPAGGDGPVRALALKEAARVKASIYGIPWPHGDTAPLLAALLTGDRSGLTRGTVSVFRSSGASHILALSGLHLGIIYGIISNLLGFLGHAPAARRTRAAVTVASCGFYVLMTGAGASITRAFLFILISEISALDPGRKRNPAGMLFLALTLQLAIRPSAISELGFQLSYLAMCGITFLFPALKDWYPGDEPESGRKKKKGPMRWIWESMALSLSCQAFTAPLVYLRFGTFPVHFLLTNLLALPLTSALVISSLAALAAYAAGIFPTAPAMLCDRIAGALLYVLETISSLPGSVPSV